MFFRTICLTIACCAVATQNESSFMLHWKLLDIVLALLFCSGALITHQKSLGWGAPLPNRPIPSRLMALFPEALTVSAVALLCGWNWLSIAIVLEVISCLAKIPIMGAIYHASRRFKVTKIGKDGKLNLEADRDAFLRLRTSLGIEEAETEEELLKHPLFSEKSRYHRGKASKACFIMNLIWVCFELPICASLYFFTLHSLLSCVCLSIIALMWVVFCFHWIARAA